VVVVTIVVLVVDVVELEVVGVSVAAIVNGSGNRINFVNLCLVVTEPDVTFSSQ
jgi:hypothetical protein